MYAICIYYYLMPCALYQSQAMYRGVGMPPDMGPSTVLPQDQSFTPTSGTTCLSLPPQVPPVFHSHLRNYLSLTPLLCTSSLYILINS